METIFIREINHLKTVSDLKYKYNRLILTHKKITIRLSCFCLTATVTISVTNLDFICVTGLCQYSSSTLFTSFILQSLTLSFINNNKVLPLSFLS